MENTTVTIQNDFLIGDAGEIGDLDGDPRLLVAHELAHHWFGDLVTCLGWSNLWLNEAWASYLELLFEREKGGRDAYLLWFERYREWYIQRGEAARAPIAQDWFTQGQGGRANHMYFKGPWVLAMIERELGEEDFWHAVRFYLKRHAGGLVTTQDFTRAVFDATGRNIEGLIEQWVEAGGYPIYDVSFNEKAAIRGEGPLELRVQQVQDTTPPVPLFDMPIDVDLHFAGGKVVRHTVRVRELDETFALPLEGELVDIVFDADCRVLCSIRLDKGAPMWMHQAELEENIAARWRALDALHTFVRRSPPVQAFILDVLRNDREPLMRQRAAQYADFAEGASVLVLAVLRDESPRVRLEAVKTLTKLFLNDKQLALLELHLDKETSPAVIKAIRNRLGLQD